MSTLKVDSIQDKAGTGAPDFPNGISVGGVDQTVNGEVRVYRGNGHGSTNNKIRRFVTIEKNTGSSITYADSSTNGGSFTINQDGIYAITYSDASTAAAKQVGVSKNSTELTTSVANITPADRVGYAEAPSANTPGLFSLTTRLSAGDVIRAHTAGDANAANANDTIVYFHITQIVRL